MPTLHIVRHAKSNRDIPGVDDHDRPLSSRGRKAAPAMARWLAAEGVAPDLILVSTAVRCLETLTAMLPAFPTRPEISAEPALYLAPAEDLLERLHRLSAERHEVMLIGHNPGMQELAATLAGDGTVTDRSRLLDKFPTGAAATLTTPRLTWAEIGPSRLRLVRFVRPVDIAERS